jgi:RimJ/RimL family protein N-acetyltransferase
MQIKLLTIRDYFDFFNFQDYGTGCGIDTETDSCENYFWAQTFLPKIFFDLENEDLIKNAFFVNQIENIPERIQVKFELFGIGNIGNFEAFIFKPWVVNIDNPMLFNMLESFHLFVPGVLFYNLIERLIFLEQLNPNVFESIRILQDIPTNTFCRFGLDREFVPKEFNSDKLVIQRIKPLEEKEILNFYSTHWEPISSELQNKYFRPAHNTWFRITYKESFNQLSGHRDSMANKTVGFLRLYHISNSFTGGISLEFIIDKKHRNKGYATEATMAIIHHLETNSYAISLGAVVNLTNEFSVRLFKRLGFSECSSGPYIRDNFTLPLFNNLKQLEAQFEAGDIAATILNKYADKYRRYF